MKEFKEHKKFIDHISKQVQKMTKNMPKPVVVISGASGSGKSYNAKLIKKELANMGISATMLSMDDFYMGISRICVSKVNQKQFGNMLDADELSAIVKSVIGHIPYEHKFSKDNKAKLAKALKNKVDTKIFIDRLEYEYRNIDFDDPEIIDTKQCAELIEAIRRDEEHVYTPHYSKIISEQDDALKTRINAKATEVIICEGLYTICDKFLGFLNPKNTLKVFIDADKKTTMYRRLRRDIAEGGTSMGLEQTFNSLFLAVIPGYLRYIKPCKDNADIVFIDRVGKIEAQGNKIEVTLRYPITEANVRLLKSNPNTFKYVHSSMQTDYYFTQADEQYNSKNFIMRLRIEDGKIGKIILRFRNMTKDANLFYTLPFNLTKEGAQKFKQSPEEFISKLERINLIHDLVVTKKRETYMYEDKTCLLDYVGDKIYFNLNEEFTYKEIGLVTALLDLPKYTKETYYDEFRLNDSKSNK
ncbi:MAG: hypothetical protein FWD89_00585 [Firmicutes bacterium]|nr:hypothetical protein [Bacillota bacterium]